jgi:hypothetical protein
MAKELLAIALSVESEAVKLAAVKDALDRTIGRLPTTVEIGPSKPYEEIIFDGIATTSRAQSRARRGYIDQRRKKLVAEQALDIDMLTEISRGNW